MVPSPIAMDSPDKMASRTRHFRNIFEELDVIRKNVIQFSNGSPSLRMLAKLRPVLYEATRIRTENEKTGQMFQYGDLRGDLLYVTELAKFLSKQYNEPVCSDDLVCTGGATSGLLLQTSLVFKPGDYIFVEDPSYFIALRMFATDLNMNVAVVPMDDKGIDVEAFDKMLAEYSKKLGRTDEQRPYRAMFYTIPVFHNPTSRILPADKCAALIKVLRKHDVLAVCDDVYNMINFEKDSLISKRLFSYDKKTDSEYKGHVVSNGTFSKIVGPGMRLGWIEGPETVVNKIIRSYLFKSGGGTNQYTSAIIGTALQTGILSEYIKDAVQTYQSKMEVMCQALDEHMKPYIKYAKPKGGYFIWVQLLVECDVEAFLRYCLMNYNVDFRPGPCFSMDGNFKNYIRLSFTYVEEDQINKGIKELATALENFMKKQKQCQF